VGLEKRIIDFRDELGGFEKTEFRLQLVGIGQRGGGYPKGEKIGPRFPVASKVLPQTDRTMGGRRAGEEALNDACSRTLLQSGIGAPR